MRIETTPDRPPSLALNILCFLLPVIIPGTQLAACAALSLYLGRRWSDPIGARLSEFFCLQYISGFIVALYLTFRGHTLRLRTGGRWFAAGTLLCPVILLIIFHLLAELFLP